MKHALFGGAMRRLVLAGAIVAGFALAASPSIALAQGSGYLEICKYSSGLSGTPSFTFDVSGISTPVTVPNNSCTAPFSSPSGDVTVTEVSGSWYTVGAISTDPGSALISSNPQGSGALNSGPNGKAVVWVKNSTDPSTVTTVNYTNDPVYGYVEVCKNNASDAGLTGNWTFGITGNNAFATTVSVPIGDCSFPVQVPAGKVTVTETPGVPTSISNITVQNGSPSWLSDSGGTATVTVAPEPAAGDSSQEAIVTFYNETVQLKICKAAAEGSTLTSAYMFTAVGTGDPSFPSGITKTVSVLPGQCQLVPGPYTNPNGTTGWRAGTQVAISEGVVPGTAVTGITISPSNRLVPDTLMLSPLPDPTTPGPAGSASVLLGSGETDATFTNAWESDGTLKVCEAPSDGLPVGTSFSFTATSTTPTGSTATFTVPAGACKIVTNPVTSDGGWYYNSTVTIAQTPVSGEALVPPITVSPTARLLSQTSSSVNLSIGSGDVTIATFTNDPGSATSSSGGSGGGSSSGGSNAGGSSSTGSSSTSAGSTAKTIAVVKSTVKTQLSSSRLMSRGGHQYLLVHVNSASGHVVIRVVEFGKGGKIVRSLRLKIAANKTIKVLLARGGAIRSVRVTIA
jgi:hypothetical protein